jgi:hypothetical protein
VNLYVINTTVSSAWTTSSRTYTRHRITNSNHYYETFEVTVPETGSYVFMSNTVIDTYGCLYSVNFFPASTSLNLLTCDDDSGDNGQFKFTVSLQPNVRYILVATTFNPEDTGSYTVVTSGLMKVNVVRTDNMSIILTSTTTTNSK